MFNQQVKQLFVRGSGATQKIQKPMMMNMSKRMFSSGTTSAARGLGFAIGAASITGITYLSYMGHQARMNTPPEKQMHLFNPVVQQRIRHTYGYFTAACAGTGAAVMLLRHSAAAHMNPWVLLALTMGGVIGTQMVDYHNNWALKNVMYAGFVGAMGVSLIPLINMYAGPVVFDAMIATGVTCGGLSAVAYNAPSEQFLNWGGPLALGLGGMLGISLLSIAYPGSRALYNVYLYGGLALFSAFMMYDTQMILHRAKTAAMYDPINMSIHIYMDAINIFIRMMQIFGNSKRK